MYAHVNKCKNDKTFKNHRPKKKNKNKQQMLERLWGKGTLVQPTMEISMEAH
jgi:hypothetical protein